MRDNHGDENEWFQNAKVNDECRFTVQLHQVLNAMVWLLNNAKHADQ